ncbi:hypothetical protein EV363DRAFT_811629 [Boletus edulis]|nr:hypothetical protein EV363DRAFT_811629 [Boletus edulis]
MSSLNRCMDITCMYVLKMNIIPRFVIQTFGCERVLGGRLPTILTLFPSLSKPPIRPSGPVLSKSRISTEIQLFFVDPVWGTSFRSPMGVYLVSNPGITVGARPASRGHSNSRRKRSRNRRAVLGTVVLLFILLQDAVKFSILVNASHKPPLRLLVLTRTWG